MLPRKITQGSGACSGMAVFPLDSSVLARIAATDAPVLILGETGTGKEITAKWIHAASGRRGSFVPIDCAALGGPLLESELFGYVRGAFTGAVADKRGLLAEADEGTAFFDEIGELPLDQQSKLLRVLQTQEYRPLGATKVRRANCRVISATNRDLAEEARRGRFRSDLLYRINIITLRLPPLRERREQILQLVEHFLSVYGPGLTLTPDATRALLSYHWPGNIRELENCIRRAAALANGDKIAMADLPEEIVTGASALSDGLEPASRHVITPPIPQLSMAELQRMAILRALECSGGDRSRAAAMLGIGRTTLYRKLFAYGIAPRNSKLNRRQQRRLADRGALSRERGKHAGFITPPIRVFKAPPGGVAPKQCTEFLDFESGPARMVLPMLELLEHSVCFSSVEAVR